MVAACGTRYWCVCRRPSTAPKSSPPINVCPDVYRRDASVGWDRADSVCTIRRKRCYVTTSLTRERLATAVCRFCGRAQYPSSVRRPSATRMGPRRALLHPRGVLARTDVRRRLVCQAQSEVRLVAMAVGACGGVTVWLWLAAWIWVMPCLAGEGTPYIPSGGDVVLQTVPSTSDPRVRAFQALRAQQSARPGDM